ncbi:MAG: hypothetical protein VX733_05195 [Candidatus Latescibacterota bacterium]|nr:hypothetical protein [Candidatus Latescibacterota bacterium]
MRCWHGSTANDSDDLRIMTSSGYYAPWFRRSFSERLIPLQIYRSLSERGQR